MGNERELIDTGTDKRYVRRDDKGQFEESDDQGRFLLPLPPVLHLLLGCWHQSHTLGCDELPDNAADVFACRWFGKN